MDGKVIEKNLQMAGISINVLKQKAEEQQITDLKDVFFAQYTTDGRIDFFLKEDDPAQ